MYVYTYVLETCLCAVEVHTYVRTSFLLKGIGPVGVHPTGVPQAMPVAVPVSSSSPKVAPSSSEG